MFLVPVQDTVYRVYFTCISCNKRMVLGKPNPTFYADLDGEPFKAYYCQECVNALVAAPPITPDRESVSHE